MTGGEVNDIRGNESIGKVNTTSVAVSLTGGKVDGSVNLDIDIGQKIPAALTVGGSMVIGDGSSSGIQISNVKSFVIDPDLTGADGCISVVLPAGYDVSQNPVIATEAAAGDLAKIKLVGDGAKGVEAYFEGNAIKVKALPTPTVNQQYKQIFANGVPLLLAAGSTDTNKTVIYMDRNGNGQLDNGTDEILDPDGTEPLTMVPPPATICQSGLFTAAV